MMALVRPSSSLSLLSSCLCPITTTTTTSTILHHRTWISCWLRKGKTKAASFATSTCSFGDKSHGGPRRGGHHLRAGGSSSSRPNHTTKNMEDRPSYSPHSPSSWRYVIPPPQIPVVPVFAAAAAPNSNSASTDMDGAPPVFPIHRIYCVGRNYAAHVEEMGGTIQQDPPIFFMKPSDAIVFCGTNQDPPIGGDGNNNQQSSLSSPVIISYPLSSTNVHYEIELVIAIGKSTSTTNILPTVEDVIPYIYGYAVGIDLTRRDLQEYAKQFCLPWDSSKGFDQSAPIGYIYPATNELHEQILQERQGGNKSNNNEINNNSNIIGTTTTTTSIWLHVNRQYRQQGQIQQMIWSIPEIISTLSSQFILQPGDLIYTGTPSGVGPIVPGDTIVGGIDGLGTLSFVVGERKEKFIA